jgi:hypothetical protein
MKLAPLLLFIVLLSCTKNQHVSKSENKKTVPGKTEDCTFGKITFNTTKRPAITEEQAKKKPKTPAEETTPSPAAATILLTFNGYRVANTSWNTNGDIFCATANLNSDEITKIITRVKEDFAPFNVAVTTDEMTYHLTNPQKRMRVVVTESWEWYGFAGGVAFYDSFTWGNNTPCFVFSTLLSYNDKYIAEAISHEVGHTLGLKHQASYSGSCSPLGEFNEGSGEGVTGWAPIMGNSYYRNVTTWHKGSTSSCQEVQDDVEKIASILGKKADDFTTMENAPELKGLKYAVMNSSNDADYFFVDSKDPITLTASPVCIGDDIGANLHLQMKIYKKNGELLRTISNRDHLTVSAQLDKGKYYVAVETFANTYQSRYGMLGSYGISAN